MQRLLILPVAALLVLSAAGCGKIEARAELKRGNSFYQQEQYSKALDSYKRGLQLDPDATFAWRSAGLSALALYRPGETDKRNQEYADTAIEAFQKFLAANPDDTKIEDYLMATYVNAEKYDEALKYIDQRNQRKPEDAPKFTQARFNILAKAGRLDEALKQVQQLPAAARAQALYSIGTAAWQKVYQDKGTLSVDAKNKLIDMGLTVEKQAMDLKPDYSDAMFYYGLLFREKAKIELDGAKRLEYEKAANEWATKGNDLRKKQAAQKPAPAPANS
ncbi:MAG TPA: tetratricopeptide repeat protein [Thermoanaerobaculia bacterium]|jgi:tetratricopeptide (TPR) repeat protein